MSLNRKLIVIVGLVAAVVTGVGATDRAGGKALYSNLKVLPKDISSKTLTKIMVDDFEDGLGVSCNFCHAEDKDSHKPDYASDAKPEKLMARAMMRMTIKLNRSYFQLKHPRLGDSLLVVNCSTCHHGQPRPGE
jgi:hypothetical protein